MKALLDLLALRVLLGRMGHRATSDLREMMGPMVMTDYLDRKASKESKESRDRKDLPDLQDLPERMARMGLLGFQARRLRAIRPPVHSRSLTDRVM